MEPTEQQIQETIALLQARLAEPGMNLEQNTRVRDGYNLAVDILAQNIQLYSYIIGKTKTTQARAIAILAVDYLNGECTQEVLVNVPLQATI